MDSLCFSSASILRCDLLARTRNFILIIPVVLEALCASLLVISISRRNLLLICESWAYLLLAILDLLSHVAPQLRRDVNAFRAANIVIGTFSFIPILLYSLFLWSLITLEFLDGIPTIFRSDAKLFFFFYIPLLVAANQFASFIGVSYSLLPGWGPLSIFPTNRDKNMWSFFTSFTLILFAALQLSVWYFATVRIIRVLRERRRREHPSISDSSRIGGITWINIGVLLSAMEAMIGFANGGFGIILTRRALRTVSRASLCIGLLIGSSTEPVSLIDARKASRRLSGLKNLISNPRLSTFRQLPSVMTVPSEKIRVLFRRLSSPLGKKSTTSDNLFEGKYVTVEFDKGVPKLHLCLSDVNAIDITTLLQWDVDKPPSLHADVDSGESFAPEEGEICTVSRTIMSRASLFQSVTHSTSEHHVRLFGGVQEKEAKGKGVMDGEKNAQFLKSLSRGSICVDKPLPEVPAAHRRTPYSALTKLTGLLRPASAYIQLLGDEMHGLSIPAEKTSDSSATRRHSIDENGIKKSKETEEWVPNREKGPTSRPQSLPPPSRSALPVQHPIGDAITRNSLWINREVHSPERTPQQPSNSLQIGTLPPLPRCKGTCEKHQIVEQISVGSAPQRQTPTPARGSHVKAQSQYTEALFIPDREPRHIMIAFTQETIAHPDPVESEKAMPNHQRQWGADSQPEALMAEPISD